MPPHPEDWLNVLGRWGLVLFLFCPSCFLNKKCKMDVQTFHWLHNLHKVYSVTSEQRIRITIGSHFCTTDRLVAVFLLRVIVVIQMPFEVQPRG